MSANTGHVIGGHEANINNPNTSEESKQHSREVLENANNGGEIEAASKSGGEKNPNNVAGGLKATLSNPNSSEDVKQSAKERLDSMKRSQSECSQYIATLTNVVV